MSDDLEAAFVRMLEASEAWTEAKRELRECVQGCRYDAGYFCDRQTRAEAEARAAYLEAFRVAVHAVRAPMPDEQGTEERP